MDIGLILKLIVVVAVVWTVWEMVGKFKEIRKRNPTMSKGKAFKQLMDETNAEDDRRRAERRAERAKRDENLANETEFSLLSKGLLKYREEGDKQYYVDPNTKEAYSYDKVTHEFKHEPNA